MNKRMGFWEFLKVFPPVAFLVLAPASSADERILVERPDGGVGVVCPAFRTKRTTETMDQFLTRIRLRCAPYAVRWKVIDASEVPTDRYFRNAWRLSVAGDQIRIPRAGAEALHRQNLRRMVERKREKWIDRWSECQATGDAAGAAAAQQKLQALQSVESTDLTTPATLQDLKSCVPHVLKEQDP